MARIKFDGEWYDFGDGSDETARLLLDGLIEAVTTGNPVTIVATSESSLGSVTLFWTPGVPITFETTFPLNPSR
jgi:hypothetical protein